MMRPKCGAKLRQVRNRTCLRPVMWDAEDEAPVGHGRCKFHSGGSGHPAQEATKTQRGRILNLVILMRKRFSEKHSERAKAMVWTYEGKSIPEVCRRSDCTPEELARWQRSPMWKRIAKERRERWDLANAEAKKAPPKLTTKKRAKATVKGLKGVLK